MAPSTPITNDILSPRLEIDRQSRCRSGPERARAKTACCGASFRLPQPESYIAPDSSYMRSLYKPPKMRDDLALG